MDSRTQGSLAESRGENNSSPPALPVKQRRSLYSQSSSSWSSLDLESEGDPSSPSVHQNQTSSPAVHPTPTDCHEPQCPIHHPVSELYCSHSVRFLSDSTPPPLPKKRLTRALSLPGDHQYIQCFVRSGYQSYDSTQYMASRIKYPCVHPVSEDKAVSETSVKHHLSLLDFDTPDSQISGFFKNFQNLEQVSLDIQWCHFFFLKSMVQRLEESLLKRESTRSAERLEPTDFVLCQRNAPKMIGSDAFYPVVCSKLPGCMFAAKVSKSNVGLSPQALLPHHINIEEIIVRYPQCQRIAEEQQVSLAWQKGLQNKQEHITAECLPLSDKQNSFISVTQLSCESNSDRNRQGCANDKSETVLSLVSECCSVDIVRDSPWGSLEDFVQEGEFLHHSQPEVYERRLGLVLLQASQGLEHLLRHEATCAELVPQRILLLWPEPEDGQPEEPGGDKEREEDPEGRDLTGSTDRMWRIWRCPRVVLTGFQYCSETDRSRASEELQLAALLRRCLHFPEMCPCSKPEQPTQEALRSPYTSGLLQLATSLEQGELKVVDAPGVLQAILWGPRSELIQQNPAELHSWLTVKRALLILNLAERGLSINQHALDWEDYLCLQYYCLTPTDTLLKSSTILARNSVAC